MKPFLFLRFFFIIMALCLIQEAIAGPRVIQSPVRETYDDACCEALGEYVRCEDAAPEYKQNFKAECTYLGSRIRSYSMEDLAALYEENCPQPEEDTLESVLCNLKQ